VNTDGYCFQPGAVGTLSFIAAAREYQAAVSGHLPKHQIVQLNGSAATLRAIGERGRHQHHGQDPQRSE
jgi:hypothetical protein